MENSDRMKKNKPHSGKKKNGGKNKPHSGKKKNGGIHICTICKEVPQNNREYWTCAVPTMECTG
jgi:hypothetical protein